jgi:hypothetical protein
VTGRNATVSNQGGYWVIDNTSGTTIVNNVSGSFNSGATSYTFPSKILDNRVLIGYQDNGSSNNGVSYVLDLSTETLKSIAGVAKEAGVETNVIDVVTQGECDFLSGLTPGSYYYSSGTGFLSASVGDYEVGVAKSATNLLMLESIQRINPNTTNYIEEIYLAKKSPSLVKALELGLWKTREIKTTSGTFTVPAGVYYLMVVCCGQGGAAAVGNQPRAGGGGGGYSASYVKVIPGQQIPYVISTSATCLGMSANAGAAGSGNTAGTGGTATGGDYNFSGGIGGVGSTNYGFGGGGGAGGGAGGGYVSGAQDAANIKGGGGGGRAFPASFTPGRGGILNPQYGAGSGGGGSPRFNGGDPVGTNYVTGASLGFPGRACSNIAIGSYEVPNGVDPFSLTELGMAIVSDCLIAAVMWDGFSTQNNFMSQVDWGMKLPFGHAYPYSASIGPAFGGAGGKEQNGTCGFGAGSGGSDNSCEAGVLGGSGGTSSAQNLPGYGGGRGGNPNYSTGGAAVVIFIY